MIVIPSVISVLENFKCDTCALFVFKVHVEKINARSDTISRQMANFEKICKICCGKVKVLGALRTLLRRIPTAQTVTDPGHSLGYARRSTLNFPYAPQINVIRQIRHRTNHMHS